jgi:hypothetical protein
VETVHATRPGGTVDNDDQGQMMCRFESGAMGHLYFSRIHRPQDGLRLRDLGTKGAIRFDQEDQNALWLYKMEGPEATRGFTKILTGPAHPDYLPFCQGPGHGTGYQDQIIIEARDFLQSHRDRRAGLADLPRRPGGQHNRGRRARLVPDQNLANHPNALKAYGHDHPNRQCALLLGRRIRKRSAQSGMAHGARRNARGGLHRHRAGARRLHARGPPSSPRRSTSTGWN